MATNEEKIITDETCCENDVNGIEIVETGTETGNDQVLENEPAHAKRDNTGLKSAAAVGGGAAAGIAAAMVITSFKEPEEPITAPTPEVIPEPLHFDGLQVPIAQTVNDGMSFNEAFSTARQEVGPGGIFPWHQGTYGTYYINEWKGFSEEYRSAFSNFPYHIIPEPQLAQTVIPQPIPETDSEETSDSSSNPEPAPTSETELEPASASETDTSYNPDTEISDEPETEISDAAEPETETDTSYNPGTEISVEPETEINDAAEPETDTVIEPEDDTEAMSQSDLEPEPEPAFEINPEPESFDTDTSASDDVTDSAESIVIVGQEITVVSSELDGQYAALVDTVFDDDYEIKVVDDNDNMNTPLTENVENIETEAGSITPDFNNDTDVSNFD